MIELIYMMIGMVLGLGVTGAAMTKDMQTAIAAPIVTGFIVSAAGSFSIAFVVAGVVMLIGILSITFFLGCIEKIPDEEKKAILD